MKFKFYILFLISLLTAQLIKSQNYNTIPNFGRSLVTFQQAALDGNNINSWIINTGTFDQDRRFPNTPGFEWPVLTGQQLVLSAGLTISAYYNGNIRMAAASHTGEYVPGYIIDSSGTPVAGTDASFKIYKVKRSDNPNNPDWLNWGLMVPYGAPFTDVNHDGIYEPGIDTPGVKGAAQTIFLCMTDGFPWSHTPDEGFGGGTQPLYAEVHMTAWCYDEMPLGDAQFIKWDVINKSYTPWNGAYFSIICNPSIGCPLDDLMGTDSSRGLAFAYNGEEVDCSGPYRYSGIVPAVGFLWLDCNNYRITSALNSIVYYSSPGSNGPPCDHAPGSDVVKAYNFMRGYKNEGSQFVVPQTNPPVTTKYCYNGNPETGAGWTSNMGRVGNCGGLLTGPVYMPNDSSQKFVMSSGADNLTINPGDTHTVIISQLAARGANRRNSVTILKTYASYIKTLACNDFVLGLNHTTETRFGSIFTVYPNYPNPFNPKTVIKYEVSKSDFLILTVYDALGKVVATLVKGVQQPGTYRVEWDGFNYPSGVYFYKLSAGGYEQTRKMVMIK